MYRQVFLNISPANPSFHAFDVFASSALGLMTPLCDSSPTTELFFKAHGNTVASY